ncbi:MAG: sigma-54 dependent transcriptional regulator [Desulfosarcinaceae bacterium]|nr:sigma-54 dependent transcriptional regulator [Desulfosarcinaceae bacterium]
MNRDRITPQDEREAKVLIIDDDEGMAYTLARMAQDAGLDAKTAASLSQGLPLAASGNYDVLFLDVRLPDGSGIDAIPEIQASPSPPEIIIITAFSDRDGAQMALKSGVWDYIEKPARIDTLKLSLKRALQYRKQKKVNEEPLSAARNGIIGESANLLMCITLMAHAAKSDANVIISGETGTGKEVFARAIHNNSARFRRPFIVVDCASLPQHLTESILFGHKKGAFTSADSDRVGLIKEADGGTLFLDEIGELPLALQKTFLRVLQERRFRPVGSKKEVKSNFRLVSATNRDLMAAVEKGRFRKDLLYRLRTIVIDLPALRERPNDIKEIAKYHMARFCQNADQPSRALSDEVVHILQQYDWPGNVRELVNTLESAVALDPTCPTLYPIHLPEHIRTHSLEKGRREPSTSAEKNRIVRQTDGKLPTMKTYRRHATEAAEKQYLSELLHQTQGDIDEACKISGLKRARLYELMKKYRG